MKKSGAGINTPWGSALLGRLAGAGRYGVPVLAAACLSFAGAAQAKKNEWEQIPLEGAIQAELPDGSSRVLEPSCSGGPLPTDGWPIPAPTEYSFFIQKGNPEKILIAFDGGGACWDAATCIASPLFPQAFGGRATYSPMVDETVEGLAASGGVLDDGNAKNPFQNYTKVFVPYCSGDIHWGSRDTTYVLDLPTGSIPWQVRHRGTDNFLAVLDWLKKNGGDKYNLDFSEVSDVTVTGASAGGYGADLAFAYVAEMFQEHTQLNLVSDSAVGVIDSPDPTQQLSFYGDAIYDAAAPGSESWGVEANLPPWVPGLDSSLLYAASSSPNSLVPSVFATLANYRPDARFASITPNLDLVQIQFYGIMKGAFDDVTAGEWYFTMADLTGQTAALPNYRFFIEDGTFHTFIFSDDQFYQSGAIGVSVADWISAIIKPGNRPWENLDAGAPF